MVTVVNSKADVLKAAQALAVNLNAAKGLQEVMKSNLGPRGTLKMLVGGAGQIKITKDGSVLLSEMQIQHPTASMIARAASAQDEFTGDGTTSSVMFIGELMKLAEQSLAEGLHPRLIAEGFELAREETVKFLDNFKIHIDEPLKEREKLVCVARTSLRTKIAPNLADPMAEVVVDAVRTIKKEDQPLDLNMVEILHMKNKLVTDTRLIKGLVLDHGARHPDMPKRLENCYILTANVNAGFFYSSAEQREKLVDSERKFTDEKVKKIIELKKKEGDAESTGILTSSCVVEENKKSFVLINQKGIDPPSLEMLAHEGIIALRRAKRRNMERASSAMVDGFVSQNIGTLPEGVRPKREIRCLAPLLRKSPEEQGQGDLGPDRGHADLVYEQSLEDDKFTFIEGVKNPQSCTVLIQGSTDHAVAQMKDAIKDGLRAVQNVVEDEAIVPGAGAFEVAAHVHLEEFKRSVDGKPRLGVEIFGKALLVVGVSVSSGDPIDPAIEGIYDNFLVKKQMLGLAPVLAEQLLLVDEVIRAGKSMKNDGGMQGYEMEKGKGLPRLTEQRPTSTRGVGQVRPALNDQRLGYLGLKVGLSVPAPNLDWELLILDVSCLTATVEGPVKLRAGDRLRGVEEVTELRDMMPGEICYGSDRIASLAALDACGTNEAQVELLVELRTLAEAERALQTAMPLACKGFNMNPEFETSSVFGTENSLLPLPSYNQESESLAAPSLMVCSPVDPAADAVDFEVDRLSETLLFAVGRHRGGRNERANEEARGDGTMRCQGAQAEAAEATAQAAQAGDEAGTSQGLPLDGLWLEAMYNVGAIALELRREDSFSEIQLYADAWCTRAIELDWQLQLEEIDETLGWVFQQVEHLKAKAQQVLILRRLEGSVESAMTVRPSFPPPSVLSLRWAMLKKPARDGVRDLQMLRKRPTGPSKVKQTVPPDPAKPPPGLLSFQQWLQGPAGHAVLARYRAS
eukprot:g32713.t1